MGSRTWIKIYCDKWLTGTLREETSQLRGIWTDVLALAGNLTYGDTGRISLPNAVPLTDEQIAGVLKISTTSWIKAKDRLLETDRLRSTKGVLFVVNWEKYQSEYFRQKSYRSKLQLKVTTQSDTEKEKEKEKEKENIKPKSKDGRQPPKPSAQNDPIQKEAERIVTRFERKIEGVKLNYGIAKNMLMGQKGFEVVSVEDLEKLVDRLVADMEKKKLADPLTRFIDMARKPAQYLE